MDFAITKPLRRVKAFAPDTFVLCKNNKNLLQNKNTSHGNYTLKTIVFQKQITKHFKTWKQ
jgi:hypothetical protein